MKKIIISVLLICCCLSMSFTFRACSPSFLIAIPGFISGGLSGLGDGFGDAFLIGVGENGSIVKSFGNDTVIFTPRTSGTSQKLNVVRIQPTSFEPKVLAAGNGGAITRSTDQGETWIPSAPVTSANLYSVDFNNTFFYAVGDNGTILISVTGGANWSMIPGVTTRDLKAVSMHSNSGGTLVAVGEKGTIVRTTNSGQNWTNVSIPDTTINFYCISQKTRQNFNATNFYIAGSQGKIYKSTDLGATWVLKNSGTTNTIRSIFFSGNDSGAVTGDNSTVRMTTNGGDTWFTDNSFNSVSGNITSITEMPRTSRTVLAVSQGNGIYIVSEDPPFIGINNISTEVPNDFSLSQNYPNPFNPSTKIQFELPKSSFAMLTVYDAAGREIETLVNEELHAGVYEYDWTGISLPSGVYFYKLTAGNFSETKKMILIK